MIVADKGSFSHNQAYIKKQYGPGNDKNKSWLTDRPYSQTQDQVMANQQFLSPVQAFHEELVLPF